MQISKPEESLYQDNCVVGHFMDSYHEYKREAVITERIEWGSLVELIKISFKINKVF